MRRPFRRRRRRQAGFTLVELMVSLVMFSFAIAGVLAVAVSMANGFREQRLGVGTESTARATMEFLADATRGASPGIESGLIYIASETDCGNSGSPVAAFSVTNSTSAPDELTATFAYGSVVVSATQNFVAGTTTSLVVTDGSQFSAGDFFVITDFSKAALVKITSVSGDTLSFAAPACASIGTISAGALVIRALRARFYIANLDGVPTLWMDPDLQTSSDDEPLAEGIEDMQIALGYDQDTPADGIDTESAVANADEWEYNVSGDTAILGGKLRAVRISLVSRALGELQGAKTFIRPAIEDRAAATVTDAYRRRVLTSIIEVRNMEGSD